MWEPCLLSPKPPQWGSEWRWTCTCIHTCTQVHACLYMYTHVYTVTYMCACAHNLVERASRHRPRVEGGIKGRGFHTVGDNPLKSVQWGMKAPRVFPWPSLLYFSPWHSTNHHLRYDFTHGSYSFFLSSKMQASRIKNSYLSSTDIAPKPTTVSNTY